MSRKHWESALGKFLSKATSREKRPIYVLRPIPNKASKIAEKTDAKTERCNDERILKNFEAIKLKRQKLSRKSRCAESHIQYNKRWRDIKYIPIMERNSNNDNNNKVLIKIYIVLIALPEVSVKACMNFLWLIHIQLDFALP